MKIIKKIFSLIFGLTCAGMIVFGGTMIVKNNTAVAEAENIVSDIQSLASVKISSEDIEKSSFRERDSFSTDIGGDYYWGFDDDLNIEIEVNEATTLNQQQTGNYYLDVDFESIKQEYPNIVAYLKVNGTNIEYPIVQGEDNSFYLKHSIDDTNSGIGWPFLDYRADVNTMIGNPTIYGHNIKNKTVFGELIKLLNNKKWFETPANSEIYFITENKTYVYKIFSVYNSSPNFNYFKTDFETLDEYNDFLSVIKSKNKVPELNTEFNFTQILTLSTCYNSGRERLVIHSYLERVKDR